MNNDATGPVGTTYLDLPEAFVGRPGEYSVANSRRIERCPATAYITSLQAKSSRLTMSSFLNNVARMMGYTDLRDCPWGMLRRHHVQAIVAMLVDSDKSPATVNNYLAGLKGVALEAWMSKILDTDAYYQLKQVKAVRGSRLPKGRKLEPSELKLLFLACERETGSIGSRDAAILSVLVGCGLRRAEIVALNVGDYQRKDESLRVLGKGNKERVAFLPMGARLRLNQWLDEVRGETAGPLFSRILRHNVVTLNRLSSQAIYHIIDTRSLQAGIEKCAPHDFRRTFASTLLEQGEDLITVKDAMGHASLTTTQKYDRRGDERLRDASKRLNICM